MRLYIKHVMMIIKSAMQYPTSFILLLIAGMTLPASSIAGFFVLFDRFGNIKGFTLPEVLFCYSIIYFGYSFTEMFLRGFDIFSRQIRNAGFDRILVRPRSTLYQVLYSDFGLARIGRISIAVGFMFYSISLLQIHWSFAKIFVYIMAIISSVSLYTGLLLLRATFCFFTIESIEITNIFIDGGQEMAAYPIVIYNKLFRVVFTYVVPFACTNYYPMLFILDKSEANIICAVAPFACILFIAPCVAAWFYGVRRYESTGS